MVAASGMLLNMGKKLEGACAARAVPARFTCHCYPPINLASSKKRDYSCLVRFSTTFLCHLWTDLAWELKLEGLSALFSYFYLYFVRRFVSAFWDSNFLEFLKLIDSC